MTPNEWIIGGDTGISSQTIWTVLTGTPLKGGDIPHDPSDFGRCYRLLKAIPGWGDRMQEVADASPKWNPLVREWDKMTELWEKESPSGTCPELYDFMKSLYDECMEAGGWVKTGPCSWTKAKGET